MKSVLHILVFCLGGFGIVRDSEAQIVFYKEFLFNYIGLLVSVPDTWSHEGINTTTKKEFIRNFGWNYEGPEANDVWSSFTSFQHMEIDTTLTSADSIYSTHFFTITVERSRTLFKRWMCGHGKRSGFEDLDQQKPGTQVIVEQKFSSPYLQMDGFGVYKKEYERKDSYIGHITTGHIYAFSHKDRCYWFKMESTTPHPPGASKLHDSIFSLIRIVD